MTLPVIKNATIQARVSSFFSSEDGCNDSGIWLGLERDNNGAFTQWVDSSPVT